MTFAKGQRVRLSRLHTHHNRRLRACWGREGTVVDHSHPDAPVAQVLVRFGVMETFWIASAYLDRVKS